MRIVKDSKPRYKVQGLKSLKGVSFPTKAQAMAEARVHEVMKALWNAGVRNETSVYETAQAIIKQGAIIAKVL